MPQVNRPLWVFVGQKRHGKDRARALSLYELQAKRESLHAVIASERENLQPNAGIIARWERQFELVNLAISAAERRRA